MARAPTTEDLRNRIDRGETGDKVRVSDPAAAPLGTDDEAAGAPHSGEQVRRALDQETAPRRTQGAFRLRGWLQYMIWLLATVGTFAATYWFIR